jgi:hypothetical protein
MLTLLAPNNAVKQFKISLKKARAAVQTLKRHPRPLALEESPSPSWRVVQMISQAGEVCNLSPSALLFSRLCECTIMFTSGPETAHNSICDGCTSKKSQQKLNSNINMEKSTYKCKVKTNVNKFEMVILMQIAEQTCFVKVMFLFG